MYLPDSQTEIDVFLINLDRATERLALMSTQLDAAAIPFVRVPAVDGASLRFPMPEFSAASYKYLHGRRIVPAEVGCYLSHVECARRLLAGTAEHALIFEDDAELPADLTELLGAAIRAGADWDILRLSSVNDGPKLRFAQITPTRQLAVALFREKGAGAYVINRRAARWITGRLVPMRLAWDIAFDLEYLAGLRAVFVEPLPVNQQTGLATQIQHGVKASKLPRWRYLTVLPYRLWLELSRLVLRGGRYLGLRLRRRTG
ncbi:MAG: glycosyltransferase family 25 protein [Phaeovulum sp.]|uniref:glycosyltransferase family 25 protein n=1 Tax=Phaeovulum sp. TaxID=2934796 RepID=UPI0027317A8A|nr:glycosyltransferase family 25 protein [Phaeovulum sp.]MDP2062864.1 glycosyltransferase family 25 protein [Phaeovulum sp.]